MKTFIIFAIIILIRIISAAVKKNKVVPEDPRRKRIDPQVNVPYSRKTDSIDYQEQRRVIQKAADDKIEYNLAYETVEDTTDSYATSDDTNPGSAYEQQSEDILTVSEHQQVSHFKRNQGLTAADHREADLAFTTGANSMQANMQNRMVAKDLKKFVIIKEILDKPKALKHK